MNINRRTVTKSLLALSLFPSAAAAAAGRVHTAHAKPKKVPAPPPQPKDLKDPPPRLACVMDASTGKVIEDCSRNSDDPCHPASLTKLMTTLLVFERLPPPNARKLRIASDLSVETPVALTEHAIANGGRDHNLSVLEGLQPQSKILIRDAIVGMHVYSFNDVAASLGEHIARLQEQKDDKANKSKSAFERAAIRAGRAIRKKLEGGAYYENRFADLMNAKAKDLGMLSTNFVNASGWPDPRQISTARDIATLTNALMDERFKPYQALMRHQSFTYGGRTYSRYDHVMNTKEAKQENIDVLIAKTGYIDDSGHNLAIYAEEKSAKKGVEMPRVIVVVMGEGKKDYAGDALELIAKGLERIKAPPAVAPAPAQLPDITPAPATPTARITPTQPSQLGRT